MTKEAGPTTLEKVSVIAAPVFSTLIFLFVAIHLGAGSLGSLALLLSLGAILSMSFDVSFAWKGSGGKAVRVALHAASVALGLAVALVGLLIGLDWRVLPMGLYMAYHGAISIVIAAADAKTSAGAALADAAARLLFVVIIIYSNESSDLQAWFALAYLLGGLIAVGTVWSSLKVIDFRGMRAELREASGAAFAYALAGSLFLWVDKPIVYFLSGYDSVGYYFAVQRVVIFIAAAATVITGMVNRQLAELPREKGLRLATLMERYAFLCVLPMTVFYLLFAKPLVLAFFNETFALHYKLTYPMALGYLAVAMASPAVAWLAGKKRFDILAAASFWCLITTIMAALFLSVMACGSLSEPTMAVSIGAMAGAIVFYSMVRGAVYAKGAGFHSRMLVHLVCAAVMGLTLHWLSGFFGELRFVELVGLSLIGVLVYGVLLYLLGEFMRSEYYEFEQLRGF